MQTHIFETSAWSRRLLCADYWGMLCSTVCLLHCTAMPAVLFLVPTLAGSVVEGSATFHGTSVIAVGFFVAGAILPGYRQHRSRSVILAAATGIACLLYAVFFVPADCVLRDSTMHSEQRGYAEYCSVPAGLSLKTSFGSTQPPASDWTSAGSLLSAAGSVLLLLAHGGNLRRRRAHQRGCQPSGMTSTLTISLCCPPPTKTPVNGGTSL